VSTVQRLCGSGLAVHRLDEDTSGLMLVALNEATQLHLKDELAARKISRAYLAIVSPPVPAHWRLDVENTLVRDRGDGRRGSGKGAQAKRAVTHFRERQRIGKRASLIEARLETGRTHQIRIHLSEAGHPVLGDSLYGPRKSSPMRLALHAYSLAFVDEQGEPQHFEVGLPDDMANFVQRDGELRATSSEAPGRRAPRPRKKRKR
jgi:23S rRNA pseudouridine1911/1915/1917 synthase